jgi:hypothetical protein
MLNKNPTRFYYEQNKIKQGCDNKTRSKLTLNILIKEMMNSTYVYTNEAPGSKKFLKKLPIYMWPRCTHA